MPMDQTDKRLVNGLMWIAAVCLGAYFLPGFGYQVQQHDEEEQRKALQETDKQYRVMYPDMHPANMGMTSNEELTDAPGIPLAELNASFSKGNKELDGGIDIKEKASRMNFDAATPYSGGIANWTTIPDGWKRHEGGYFKDVLLNHIVAVGNDLRLKQVYCDDDQIGFGPYTGETRIDEIQAKEYLRELFIDEKIIELCIKAKVKEEQVERDRGVKPEAYMRIVKISPEPSQPDGPSALIPNPKFSEEERKKNPLSERARKYNVKQWKKFIQQYPVQFVLQCDSNTFQRFLYSVREQGQFLVIRNLEIVSPYISESKEDTSELMGQEKSTSLDSKNLKLDSRHIQVTISAAGMDFFDPEVYPKGLYSPPVDKTKVPTRSRHIIPAAPTAAPGTGATTPEN
jgi:hypothetical protein